MPAAANDVFNIKGTPYYKHLENFSTYMPAIKISRMIKKKIAAEPDKLATAAVWAKDRTFDITDPLKLNSIYFMIYSDLNRVQMPTSRMSNEMYKKYAWAAYMGLAVFEAMVVADAQRCANPAAVSPAVTALLSPRHEAMKHVFALFPKEKFKAAWETALEFEKASGIRPRNADVCTNNLSEVEEENEDAPDKTIPAAYIEDAAWNTAREKTRQDLLAGWKHRYEAALKSK